MKYEIAFNDVCSDRENSSKMRKSFRKKRKCSSKLEHFMENSLELNEMKRQVPNKIHLMAVRLSSVVLLLSHIRMIKFELRSIIAYFHIIQSNDNVRSMIFGMRPTLHTEYNHRSSHSITTKREQMRELL